MNQFPIVNGKYPILGDIPIYYWNTYPVGYGKSNLACWGWIGKTSCCGSAEVFGLAFREEAIYEFLKDSMAGIVLFHGYCSAPYGVNKLPSAYIKHVETEVNKMFNGIATISVKKVEYDKAFIFLTIVDRNKYRELIGG